MHSSILSAILPDELKGKSLREIIEEGGLWPFYTPKPRTLTKRKKKDQKEET